MKILYERVSFKYRLGPSVPQAGPYSVEFQTFVTGFNRRVVDKHCGRAIAMLDESGVLTIYEGAPWDGPSWFFDLKCFMAASLAHDYLYHMLELGFFPTRLTNKIRHQSDRTMRAIAREDGMPWWLRALTYAVVRKAGASYARELPRG